MCRNDNNNSLFTNSNDNSEFFIVQKPSVNLPLCAFVVLWFTRCRGFQWWRRSESRPVRRSETGPPVSPRLSDFFVWGVAFNQMGVHDRKPAGFEL